MKECLYVLKMYIEEWIGGYLKQLIEFQLNFTFEQIHQKLSVEFLENSLIPVKYSQPFPVWIELISISDNPVPNMEIWYVLRARWGHLQTQQTP
jgi:hypothetical protein